MGTATPLRGYRRPGPVRASAHLSRVLVGAGVTPAVHSHGPAPLASVVAGDHRCAHGRVNSDRAVGRPCSRLIRPQGPHPRTAAWRACLRRSHAVGCCWLFRHAVDSKQHGRSAPAPWWFGQGHPGREVRPEREAVQEGGHTPPTGQTVCCCTVHKRADLALHLDSGCRPTARKSSWRTWLAHDQRPPCWNGSRPFRKQGQRTRWTPVKKCKVPCGINPRTAL